MAASRAVQAGVIGTLAVAVLGVAGFGAYTLVDSGSGKGHGNAGDGRGPATPTATVAASLPPPSGSEVRSAAADFLTAWSRGDIAAAAQLTNTPDQATQALTAFRTTAHVTAVTATPSVQSAKQAGAQMVPYTVHATITYQGHTDEWTYGSWLTVTHRADGKPAVRWSASVLHPLLAPGDTLVTGLAPTPDVTVRDRNGVVMDVTRYPSLSRIFADFRTRYAGKLAAGTPNIEAYVRHASGAVGKTLEIVQKGSAATLDTTLDSHLQAAAEKAVAGRKKAGVTAVDIDNGGILAVAYSPASGEDWALQDDVAPGSTFKVVTAAALLQRGLRPSSPAPCRNGANYANGRAYQNDNGMNNPGATLEWDFANSCNTGFISQAGRLGGTGLLDTAAEFGLNQRWNVGTPVWQPSVPGGTGDELTSEMIGQGRLQMSPLIMASVAATARDGAFHQPRIVSPTLIDGPLAQAPGIPAGTSADLQRMMHATVMFGTASQVMTQSASSTWKVM